MAAFGNYYPHGVTYIQPHAWTSSSSSVTTWNVPDLPTPPKPKRPRTNVDWLRERVEEVCALAWPETG